MLSYLDIPAWPIAGTAFALVGGWGQIVLPWDDDIDLIIDVEGKQQLLGLYGNRSRRSDHPAAGLVDLTGTDTAAALLLGAGQGISAGNGSHGVVYQIAAPRSTANVGGTPAGTPARGDVPGLHGDHPEVARLLGLKLGGASRACVASS